MRQCRARLTMLNRHDEHEAALYFCVLNDTGEKNIMKYSMAAVLIAGAAGLAVAQETPCYEPIMVPIISHRVPGANGSLWQTQLAITNHSSAAVQVIGHGACEFNPCQPPLPMAAESTIFPRVYTPYLEVECGRTPDVKVQLRVQDLSRQLHTWGTSIPVVRESDLFENETISITDIPNTEDFRSMLRIYGFDPGVEGVARVQVFALDRERVESGGTTGDELLLEVAVAVQADPSDPRRAPAYAAVPLWPIPELSGHTLLRIEVEPDSQMRLWAFVSATNNDTQHVTVLLPQTAPHR